MMLPPPTGTLVTLSTTCPRTICAGTGPAMRRDATTSQAGRRIRRCAASIKTLPESLSPCCESYYARLYIGGARHRKQGPVVRGAGRRAVPPVALPPWPRDRAGDRCVRCVRALRARGLGARGPTLRGAVDVALGAVRRAAARGGGRAPGATRPRSVLRPRRRDRGSASHRGGGDGTRLRPSDGRASPRAAPGDRVPRGRRPGPTVRGRELRAGGDELRRAASALPRARLRRDAARAGAGWALRVHGLGGAHRGLGLEDPGRGGHGARRRVPRSTHRTRPQSVRERTDVPARPRNGRVRGEVGDVRNRAGDVDGPHARVSVRGGPRRRGPHGRRAGAPVTGASGADPRGGRAGRGAVPHAVRIRDSHGGARGDRGPAVGRYHTVAVPPKGPTYGLRPDDVHVDPRP